MRALLPPPIIELPKASVRGQISTVDTPPTCRAPAPAVDHAVEGLAEARASLKYNIAKVPSCYVTPDGIPGSVVYPVLHRSQWERSTSELLALCHEAAERRAQKTGAFRGIHHDHAEAERMSLAFIQDRIDTDDPIRGYMIRSDDHRRRLQGFIWFTTFTSWTHFFKWDSKSPAAGLRGTADRHRIRWDSDNTLAWELEQQHRAGDPRAEGVIWSRVGEISLVGGLGCGGFLLQLALEEMEATGAYDYAVVQATESSAGFYDRMGFVRVGALARYVTPGADYRKAETVAYRHFAGPDEDVSALDSSIMMAIRLRPGCIPRRVLLRHGGIYSNLGTKVAVCLQHAGEAVLSVKNTAPSSPAESVEPPATERARGSPAACSPAACVHEKASAGAREEGLTVEGLLGSSAVVGPGASSHALQIMCQIIGRPDMEEASEGKEGERGKEAEGGREGRRASEFAKRRLSTWLNPKEAKKPWELYGTPPPVLAAADERAAAEARASTLGAPRGGARRRGRGRPAGSRRVAGGAEGAVRGGRGGEDSPGCRSAQETPRAEKKRKYQEVEDVAEAHAGAGGEHDVALLVLENVRKETLRVVCGDLALQISGSRSMLVGRVQELHQESLESARHCKGKEGKGCGAAGAMSALRAMGWLDSAELKLTTLELICCDLNLFKRGTKEDLRLRIFEHGQELAGEHEAGGEACGVSGAEEDACNSGGDMQGERMSLEALRKDTLRLVCYDLHLPFSGPKHILIPRLIRKLQTDRLAAGAGATPHMPVRAHGRCVVMYVWMYVCMYVCMHVCMRLRVVAVLSVSLSRFLFLAFFSLACFPSLSLSPSLPHSLSFCACAGRVTLDSTQCVALVRLA